MTRYRLPLYFAIIFLGVQSAIRFVLLYYTSSIDTSELFNIFTIGLFYDIVTYFYYIIPFVIYLFIIPSKIFNSKISKILTNSIFFMVVYGVVFGAFSEWFFWEEFGKRFNFIAVDYLVYTHEVIRNIVESYPLPLLLFIIFIITLAIFYKLNLKSVYRDNSTYRRRALVTILLLSIPILSFNTLDKQTIAKDISPNRYIQELSKNGLYSLFSAFRDNQLDYYEFYKTQKDEVVLKRYRELVGSADIVSTKEEKRYNVMLVMIESMSASYMGVYGNPKNLTPNLDRLTKKSLFFSNLFATGTRTVRGMEAVAMSLPPTAGRSIIKRPNNHNLFGVGWVFKDKGYDNKFIYAGEGYFDNMNEYFSHNGFSIIDRGDFKSSEISFSNVWGVCDEDLFAKSIKEADISYQHNQPFFSFIMTTSNHRPYTYPKGKIDIPSHKGRDGGVKYTDYAIDKFIKDSSKKPWFDNTIFVFVADHNGGSAGKSQLPLHRYKIPLLIYAPSIIKPQSIDKLSSQIDLAPTLLSLMGWSYHSKFYGDDILLDSFRPRAFIGNYQKLGLYRDKKLTILSPDRSVSSYRVEDLTLNSTKYKEIEPTKEDVDDTIAYYQSASYFYKFKGY